MTTLRRLHRKATYARDLAARIAKATFQETKQGKRVSSRFADALQKRVVEPWRESIRQWLQEREEAPSEAELEQLVNGALQPDEKALQSVLNEFHVAAANAGGQAAINRLFGKIEKAAYVPPPPPSPPPAAAEEIPERRRPPLKLERDDSFTFNLRDPKLLKEMAQRGDKITGEVTETMLSDLRGVLAEKFYKEGLGPKALADDLDAIFPPTYANRAETIARTETLFAQAKAQAETYQRNGVEKKQWLAVMDSKTRDEHAEMHGQTVDMDKPFVLPDGSEIDFPGDPGGDAEQVINCRCDFLAVFGDEYELPEQPWLGGGEDE